MRLLVAEDDLRLATTLRRGLGEAGFSVDMVARGDDALAAAAVTPFDVIVLDVMLPGRDGIDVCAQLRRNGTHTPILMLTGRDSVDDRIRGLDAGADDYMVKPFAFGELLARLRALRRRHLPARSAVIELAGIRLDTAARRVTMASREVPLRSKEFEMLEYFMHNPGRLLTRTQIEEHIWAYDFSAESNLVEAYISRLRRKLTASGGEDPFTTVRGAGYRFDASR